MKLRSLVTTALKSDMFTVQTSGAIGIHHVDAGRFCALDILPGTGVLGRWIGVFIADRDALYAQLLEPQLEGAAVRILADQGNADCPGPRRRDQTGNRRCGFHEQHVIALAERDRHLSLRAEMRSQDHGRMPVLNQLAIDDDRLTGLGPVVLEIDLHL